jgi:DNA replication protein DnaC
MNEQILEKMKKLKLWGLYRAFKTNLESGQIHNLTTDELISIMIDSEWDDRQNRKIDSYIRRARFRYKGNIESVKYDKDRNLDKNQIMRYAECTFIEKHENLLITGSTGVGKSYIASALGHQACILGYKVTYANTYKLLTKLKMAKSDGSYVREIARLEKQNLLILDDFGLQTLDAPSRQALMEIFEDRHGNQSTIVTSQLPVKQWYDVIGEKTIADAILDRLVHGANRIDLKGESFRRKMATNKNNDNFDIMEDF